MKISTHASNERAIKCCWIWKYPPQHQMKNIHFCIRWNIRSCCIRYGYLLPDMKVSTPASDEKYPPLHQMKKYPLLHQIKCPVVHQIWRFAPRYENIHPCIRWRNIRPSIRWKYPPLHQMKISSPASDENIHSASDENIHSCIRWKISTPASDKISGPGASDNWFGREPETDNWLSFTAGQEEPFVPTTTKHQKHIDDDDLMRISKISFSKAF